MKKNIYLVSYVPLLSILLYSMSISLFAFNRITEEAKKIGLYQGLSEYVDSSKLNIALFIGLLLVCMMLFSLLKLFADTILKMSLLFFTKDFKGDYLRYSQYGSLIFLGGGVISLLLSHSIIGIIIVMGVSLLSYFGFILYKLHSEVSVLGMFGVTMFQFTVWAVLIIGLYVSVLEVLNYALKQFLKI